MTLEIHDATVRFGGVSALDHVSFGVPDGQLCAVIGPNGAGKTTLLNLLSGQVRATSGSLTYNGNELTEARRSRLVRLGISRTFQNLALFNRMTVFDNIRIGAHSRGFDDAVSAALRLPRARRSERALNSECLEIMERLHIAEFGDQFPTSLSYGTLKRVELARALVSAPSLLLLDEPAAGLTEEEAAELGELLTELRKSMNLTMILVEHHMSLVMAISDRVVALNFGRVLADGSPQSVAGLPAVIDAYLGEAS